MAMACSSANPRPGSDHCSRLPSLLVVLLPVMLVTAAVQIDVVSGSTRRNHNAGSLEDDHNACRRGLQGPPTRRNTRCVPSIRSTAPLDRDAVRVSGSGGGRTVKADTTAESRPSLLLPNSILDEDPNLDVAKAYPKVCVSGWQCRDRPHSENVAHASRNARAAASKYGVSKTGRRSTIIDYTVPGKHSAQSVREARVNSQISRDHQGARNMKPEVRELLDDSEWIPTSSRNQSASELWKSPLMESGLPRVVTVDQNGRGNFLTIQAAVNSVPARNTQRVIIQIQAGVYREKVVVPYNKPFLTFYGSGVGGTLITWNDTASHENNFEAISNVSSALYGTMQSATVTILSDGFVAQRIAFQNSAPAPKPGAVGAQAVALLIGGDRAVFYYCRFLGAQDTLYDYLGRHYYMNCYIEGSIDFIFGNGRSLFENCELHSIATSFGAIAAHQRLSPDENTGFSFAKCTVTGSGLLYLGRAWSPYARIVFAWTYLDNIISDEGWSDFGDPDRQSTTYFGQYECSGPGANLSRRAPWAKLLNQEEALPYLTLDFVDGKDWLGRNPNVGPMNGTLP